MCFERRVDGTWAVGAGCHPLAPPNGSAFSGVRRPADQCRQHLGRTPSYHATIETSGEHVRCNALLGGRNRWLAPHPCESYRDESDCSGLDTQVGEMVRCRCAVDNYTESTSYARGTHRQPDQHKALRGAST